MQTIPHRHQDHRTEIHWNAKVTTDITIIIAAVDTIIRVVQGILA